MGQTGTQSILRASAGLAWAAAETPPRPVPGHGAHVPAQLGSGAGHAGSAVSLVGSGYRGKAGARPAQPLRPFDPVVLCPCDVQ